MTHFWFGRQAAMDAKEETWRDLARFGVFFTPFGVRATMRHESITQFQAPDQTKPYPNRTKPDQKMKYFEKGANGQI